MATVAEQLGRAVCRHCRTSLPKRYLKLTAKGWACKSMALCVKRGLDFTGER